MLEEIMLLIGAIPGAAPPPVIFLAGPWLLFALMLSGPFAFLVTLVVVMLVAATVFVALTAAILAILAAPYLLVRRLRGHRARRAFSNDHAAQLVRVESPRVVA
jgi:ABC-type bacteriocin/lantibiotic exporter with double-glycine peptidase domain